MLTALYLLLLTGVGASRLVEIGVSRRRQRRLLARGARAVDEPSFPWIVLVHTGILAGSAVEVLRLRRPLIAPLAAPAGCVLALATALRWWVIQTMADHWNVHVVDSLDLGVVTGGPFRWLRHPNYVALLAELGALPLLHGAWLTALAGGVAHALVLRQRIAREEAMLMRHPAYRAAMGSKPRFLPRLSRS